ncbi:MAG: efflux RND transporter periplasmic adaptor subunit, partial [Cyanobacteriota bacterium]|nr:efflux RND transporter periplasmic adaptor subunit [Cyanobacteriota bacterium]
IIANPFWPSDGYGWIINFFRLPKTYLSRAFKAWGMMLERRPLPTFLTLQGKIGLILYGLITVIFWTIFFAYSGILLAASLERNLQGGGVLVFGGIFILFVAWFWWLTSKFGVKADSSSQPNLAATETVSRQRTNGAAQSDFIPVTSPAAPNSLAEFKPKRKRRRWQWIKFLLLAIFVALLFLPYQYHTGGEIQLLAPDRQEIQAEVDAYVREVFFKGGDGTWIEAGTPIATMEAAEIKNRFLTTKERIQEQQALLKKQQADLDKLQAGARPEEIDIARQKVSVAREELAVAREQFEQARIEAELSARRASRFEQLYRDGAVSLQQSEDNRRLAETDRTTRETANKNIGALQKKLDEAQAGLELVQSGARSEDLEAARQEVIATRAQIRRLEQDLKFLDSQLQLTELVMPFEGKLTTPHLEQKMGSYLEKGDTFAVVENDRTIRGEVAVPEFQVGEISANGRVLVKLSAYPQTTLVGKVISIEPNAREVSYGRIVNVLVELSNSEQILKPGMSGYAKIEGRVMPVIVAFTRAIVRFVLIEVWSWFP